MDEAIVRKSFYITYVFLITTGTITFIESLRTVNPVVRHIMNLETCISIVASYFYSVFVDKVKDAKVIPYTEINSLRYTDWFISTPLMLFVLCMVLANEKKIPFTIGTYIIVLLLDIAMLFVGYLGEIHKMSRITADAIGFVFFLGIFGYIWNKFMRTGKNTFGSTFTYYSFLIVWALYGVVYLTNERTKNVAYNILDLIAKAFIGIFFWMYFTKSVKF
jgi:bacteriorhodopsin